MLQKIKNLLGINLLSILGWMSLFTNLYWIIPMILSGHDPDIGFDYNAKLVFSFQTISFNFILALLLLELLIKHFFHKQCDITFNNKFLNILFYLGLIFLIPIIIYDILYFRL